MKSLGQALIQYDWCLYKKGKFGHKDRQTWKMPCEDKGRNQGNSFISQRVPEIASKPLEAKRGAWKNFFLIALRRNQPC